jgi:hypothetical protein
MTDKKTELNIIDKIKHRSALPDSTEIRNLGDEQY